MFEEIHFISCPTLGLACVLMSRPISPELVLSPDFWISNIPRYLSFASYNYIIFYVFRLCFINRNIWNGTREYQSCCRRFKEKVNKGRRNIGKMAEYNALYDDNFHWRKTNVKYSEAWFQNEKKANAMKSIWIGNKQNKDWINIHWM